MYLNKLLILKKLQQANTHLGLTIGPRQRMASRFSAQRAQSYIFGFRSPPRSALAAHKFAPIIDLDKTVISLRRACNVIQLIIRSNGHLLFVNTNPKYNKIIQQTAKCTNQSYINHKWIGGFLTNWNHMRNVQQQFHAAARFTRAELEEPPLRSLHLLGAPPNDRGALWRRAPGDLGAARRHLWSRRPGLGSFFAPPFLLQGSTEENNAPAPTGALDRVNPLRGSDARPTPRGKRSSGSPPGDYPPPPRGSQDISLAPSSLLRRDSDYLKASTTNFDASLRGSEGALAVILTDPRYKKMQKCFEGLRKLSPSAPKGGADCVIIFNANQNSTAIYEAHLNQIPIISVVDSNIPNELYNLITYPIPANYDSVQFIYLFCNCILKTILVSR